MDTSTASTRLAELRATLDPYRTCELATLGRDGVPIAWPTAPLVRADGTIVLTTSIALPQKAYNIRRDPRVALLFSDPTGSGRSDLPQVLVQGTATCPDVISTSPRGLEEYWARLAVRQPSSRGNSGPVARRLLDWYYMRLVITVTPHVVTVRPPLREPARLDAAPTSRTDSSPYAELARRLPTYRSAVLGAVRGDELPSLQRVGLRPDPGRRGFRLQVDATPGTAPGPASLLLHRHDDQLWDLRTAGAVGRVAAEQDGWLFLPERSVAGTDGLDPVSVLRTVRRLRRTARGYLDRRHLDRPAVSWAEHRAVARTAA